VADKRVTGRGASTDLYMDTKRPTAGLKSSVDTGAKLGDSIAGAKQRRQDIKTARGKKQADKNAQANRQKAGLAARAERSKPNLKKHSVHTLRGR
jgi:hypothetical protein